MRHRKTGRKLGRNTSHRKAMMRNMVTSLFDCEKITTTDARAKELRNMAEKLITLARRGDLAFPPPGYGSCARQENSRQAG